MSRTKKIILIIIGIIVSLGVAFYVYLYIGFSQSKKGVEQAMKRFTPGTAEYETYKKWNKQFDDYYGILNKAKEYEGEKKYDLAIEQYNIILSKKADDYIANKRLIDVYDAMGRYDEALRQIQIVRQLRPNLKTVQDEMASRESSIKEKISQQ